MMSWVLESFEKAVAIKAGLSELQLTVVCEYEGVLEVEVLLLDAETGAIDEPVVETSGEEEVLTDESDAVTSPEP